MSDTAIKVENLGKRYRIGVKQEKYTTLRDTLTNGALIPFQAIKAIAQRNGNARTTSEYIWALKNLDFEIKQGEVVGIIGGNGAGKSTLLKILSRITEPTTGFADVFGRVGSLLEVGTGFHPELTGRENLYLNGAILGMKKAEIKSKFDEILAFAGVEKFIDTPVKRYSSGMYLRLAFAIAAHLDPEILLVDEVLAVGDAAFQKKCLQKMSDVAKEGRTVLFVSHNLQAVQRLCTSALLLREGSLIERGAPPAVISSYLESSLFSKTNKQKFEQAWPDLRLKQIKVVQDGHEAQDFLDNGKPFDVHIRYEVLNSRSNLILGFDIVSSEGTPVFRTYDMKSYGLRARDPGVYESICHLRENLFQTGHYYLNLLVGFHRINWLSRDRISIRLNFDGARSSDVDFPGLVLSMGDWTVTRNSQTLSATPVLPVSLSKNAIS